MGVSCRFSSSFGAKFKVGIVGAGNVGASAGYAMLLDGTPSEIVIIDRNKDKAEGLQLDFSHGMSFLDNTLVSAGDDYGLLRDADLVVVTAGAKQKDGETRLDLVAKNKAIFKSIIPKIAEVAPNAILLIVANPVDVLTYEAWKLSGFPRNRVFGSGTMLDTTRFRYHISKKLCLSPKSVNAFILGEHGDSSFPVFSSADVAGKPLMSFDGFSKEVAEECYLDTKKAAYRIIHDMGFTSYSIGVVIREIMLSIFSHSKVVVPLSYVLKGEYGFSDVAISVPCVLDSDGVSSVIEIPLDEKEMELFEKSVSILKELL